MRITATLITGCALLTGGILAAGCGGDGEGDSNGDAASAADVTACVEEAGLTVEEQPGDETIGVTEALFVDIPEQRNRVIVNFFEDSEAASSFQEGEGAFLEGAGAGGNSEVVGNATVAVARSGAEEELETVKGCVEG